jgi:hypothetical protein
MAAKNESNFKNMKKETKLNIELKSLTGLVKIDKNGRIKDTIFRSYPKMCGKEIWVEIKVIKICQK